jgi:hypothetical protein
MKTPVRGPAFFVTGRRLLLAVGRWKFFRANWDTAPFP